MSQHRPKTAPPKMYSPTGGGKTLSPAGVAKKAKTADYKATQDKAFTGMKKSK